MAMVDELTRIARENSAEKITLVQLKIGKMSGIVTDSLKFAFDAIKLEHPLLSSAEIVIREIPLVYQCSSCSSTFETEDAFYPVCVQCDSSQLTIISGTEQHIENVEVEV